MVNFSLKFETLSMRRVFKGSRDAASLLVLEKKVLVEKKFLVGRCRFFVSDVISGRLLSHFGPLHLFLGPNR